MLRQLEPLLRGGCDALFVFDADSLDLVAVSDRTRALFGDASAQSAPPPLTRYCEAAAPFDVESLLVACARARRDGNARLEFRFVRASDRPLWLDLRMWTDTLDERRVVLVAGSDTTDAKMADAELRRTRAFLEAAIRQSGIGILMMQEGSPTTTIANRAAREVLGVDDVDERSPLTTAAEWPEIRRGGVIIEPKDFPVVRAFTHREVISAEEIDVVRADGSVRTVMCSAAPVIDDEGVLQGSIVLFPDVTEWRRSEANVRERDRLLQVFHDQIRDAVYAIDSAGRIDYVTPSVERLIRRQKRDLIGKTLRESGIIGASSLVTAESDLATVLAGHALTARDYDYVSGAGEECVGEVTGSPLRDEDGKPRALFVVRDVTARRRDAALLAARETRTRQSQKLEALGTLSAGFAHEMNNPLTGILNLAELIELGLVKPEGMKDIASRIKSLCDRMTTTTRNLLAFAAADSRTTRVVSLVAVADLTLELVSPRLKRDGILCTRRIVGDAPFEVEGRESELQQLLLILLTNACEATLALPEGHTARRQVEILIERPAPDTIRVAVKDTGTGIANDIAHRVFDPFFTTKPPDRGVGLGLWVGRGIAREHGGTLDFETCPGVGTTFLLELPSATPTTEDM